MICGNAARHQPVTLQAERNQGKNSIGFRPLVPHSSRGLALIEQMLGTAMGPRAQHTFLKGFARRCGSRPDDKGSSAGRRQDALLVAVGRGRRRLQPRRQKTCKWQRVARAPAPEVERESTKEPSLGR